MEQKVTKTLAYEFEIRKSPIRTVKKMSRHFHNKSIKPMTRLLQWHNNSVLHIEMI